MRRHRETEGSTPRAFFSAKACARTINSRLHEKQHILARARTNVLEYVLVTSPKTRDDGFKQTQLRHDVEARGGKWRAEPQIPRRWDTPKESYAYLCVAERKELCEFPAAARKRRNCLSCTMNGRLPTTQPLAATAQRAGGVSRREVVRHDGRTQRNTWTLRGVLKSVRARSYR